MNNDDREELYELIEDIGTAMLVTEADGELRSRPMSGNLYRDSGEIWFLTESRSGKAQEISEDRTSNLTCSAKWMIRRLPLFASSHKSLNIGPPPLHRLSRRGNSPKQMSQTSNPIWVTTRPS